MNETRLEKLKVKMAEQALDWIALVPSPSFTYLSGMHAHTSERPIVMFISAETVAVIIPTLEAVKAEEAGIDPAHIFAWSDQEGYVGAFEKAAQTLGLAGATMGVEALKMRVLERDMLMSVADGLILQHADGVLDDLRLRKDSAEIAAMQHAVDVAEKAMHAVLPQIKIGMTERQVAGKIVSALFDAGADGVAFGPIVSAGPNAASPHASPTDRPLGAGELLIIDWGARVGDYVSDITRTFALGEIDDVLKAVYETVKASNAAGVAASAPGVTGEAIDRASRDVIEEADFGQYFIHRTGHGLGMEAHEAPSMVEGNTNPLPVGAVFTVEPGIYLPNKGGCRIEDDVVITEDGYLSLTTFPRDLMTIG